MPRRIRASKMDPGGKRMPPETPARPRPEGSLAGTEGQPPGLDKTHRPRNPARKTAAQAPGPAILGDAQATIHGPPAPQAREPGLQPVRLTTSEPAHEPDGTQSRGLAAAWQWVLPEEALAHDRRRRTLAEDHFATAGQPKPAPATRARPAPLQPAVVRFVDRPARREAGGGQGRPPSRRFTLGQTFAVAAAMALAAGAGVGLLTASLPPPARMTGGEVGAAAEAAALPSIPSAPRTAAEESRSTTITKKAVATATLEVADVSGQTNSFIPLALRAEPGTGAGGMLLKISGIPEGAYLTSGKPEEDQVWALSLDDVRDVKLVVPKAQQPQFDLAVAAFEPRTGELAAPVKTMTVALSDVRVQPASAPPPDQLARRHPVSGKSALTAAGEAATVEAEPIPPPPKLGSTPASTATAEASKLVNDGDMLLKDGELAAARKRYGKAWETGAAAGAFGMGRTYDPLVLASLELQKPTADARPDKAKALAWYRRAAVAGEPQAAGAIVRLRLTP